MGSLERRRPSALSRADDALLVVGVIVAAVLVLAVIGWVVHAVIFLVKLVVVAAVIALAVRVATHRRDR